jgi:uncharacterized protein (DUF427 family)
VKRPNLLRRFGEATAVSPQRIDWIVTEEEKMSQEVITIKETEREAVLASAPEGEGVRLFEGAWYFDPDAVDATHLVVTDRTYVCPYKGTCYWIDLNMPDHKAENVGFVYFDVYSGYEFIKDQIAFYTGRREATYEETSLQ